MPDFLNACQNYLDREADLLQLIADGKGDQALAILGPDVSEWPGQVVDFFTALLRERLSKA